MPKESQPSVWKKWKQWLKAVPFLALLAVGVTVLQFYFKDVFLPGAAINITVDLGLKQTGTSVRKRGAAEDSLIAVEVALSAANPSSRIVYLLKTIWFAKGLTIRSRPPDERTFSDSVTTNLLGDGQKGQYTESHMGLSSEVASETIIAVGSLFPGELLRPGEKIMRRIVFHVPANTYDVLAVEITIPTTAVKKGVDAEWHWQDLARPIAFGPEHVLVPIFQFCEPVSGAPCRLIPPNADGKWPDDKRRLQAATSTAELSLWR